MSSKKKILIIQPIHTAGIKLLEDNSDYEFEIVENTEKIIVFNHRPEEYKDFNNFMSIVDELREQRQDFKRRKESQRKARQVILDKTFT